MPEAFGRYELRDLLGRGGMGEVYRAYDTDRDRTVALKLLPHHLAVDETYKSRFRRESRLAARLNEPHIVPIHDFGEIDGRLFIDMRLVEGQDLGKLLSHGPLPLDVAVDIVGQVAAALDAAHESGLVHRDVKPSNVLLTGSDPGHPFVYLVDFGIARSDAEPGTAITATTGTVGTVAYMSPERIGGEHGDPRADVYALACVLYEMLTGHKPYEGEFFAIMYAHVNAPVPSARATRPDVPAALDAVIATGMAKDPAHRYAHAGELARAARSAIRGVVIPSGTQIGTATAPPAPPAPPQGPPTGPPPGPPTGPPTGSPPPLSGPLAHPSGPLTPQPVAARYVAPPEPPRYAATPARPPSSYQPDYRSPSGPVGPPSGPVGPPSGPVGPLSGPVGPPSGPVWTSPGGGPPRRDNSRKRAIIAVLATLVVVGAAVGLVVALKGGSGSNGANGATTGPTSHANSPTPSKTSTVTSSPTGAASLPTGPDGSAISWANFASFTKLLGTRNGDTAHAFKGASCQLEGREGSADIAGIVDQVKCTIGTTDIYVARFSSAAMVSTYLAKTATDGYTVTPVSMGATGASALVYTAPDTSQITDITTRICALPNYLVQFASNGTSRVPVSTMHDAYWGTAVFPDVVPPQCNSQFTGPQPGVQPRAGIGATKPEVPLAASAAGPLLLSLDPAATMNSYVTVTSGVQAADVNQTGSVSFWQWSAATDTASRVGTSTYPYEPSQLGAPGAKITGGLLTGMSDATFIVSGHFSTDGSGNAVAYTRDDDTGWGAVKAEKNGNLAASGAGVKPKGIGLSQGFALSGGLLETSDCPRSTNKCGGPNLVLKYWRWVASSQQFVLDHRAGLPN